jgi:hypothetical protein
MVIPERFEFGEERTVAVLLLLRSNDEKKPVHGPCLFVLILFVDHFLFCSPARSETGKTKKGVIFVIKLDE